MKCKDVELIEAKAEGQGIVRALTAVFGNVDRQGDKLLPGSFSKTLRKWRESGRRLPVVFSHGSDNPMNFLGSADPYRVRETPDGLEVEAEFDVDENPVAKQVYSLLRKGALPGWSFGYLVPPGGKRRRDGHTEISEVELFEVGPTLIGANPEARTLAVKAFEEADQDQPDLEELRVRSLAAAAEALAGPEPRDDPPPPSREELDAEFEALRRAHLEEKAAKAAKARAAEEEDEAMRHRMFSFPRPPTRIELQPNGTYMEVDARDPDDISPGLSLTGALLPSRNELKAREQRREAEQVALREQEEQEEKQRRERETLREAERQRAEQEGWITVDGVRMTSDGRIIP